MRDDLAAAERVWLRTYPPDLPHTVEPRGSTLLELWRHTVDRRRSRPILHHLDHSISADELDRRSDALAAGLQRLGLAPGERIAIYLQNDPHWVTGALAAWKAGAVVVPVNPMVRDRELRTYLDNSGAAVLLTSPDFYDDVAAGCIGDSPVRLVLLADPFGCCRATDSARPELPGSVRDVDDVIDEHDGGQPAPAPVGASDIALLTYTSGTTGPPKGAMNTHGNLAYNAEMATTWFRLGDDDVVLGIAPLFHITGLVVQLAVTLSAGSPLILFHRFDASEALRLAEKWRATYSIGAITAYIAMMGDQGIGERDLSSLQKVFSGGAPVSAATVERFEALTGVYIHNAYGLTETTAPSILTPLGVRAPVDTTSGALSVGLPVQGVDVTVVDKDTREPVAPGEAGEIVISGPMVVPGYWNKPKESRDAMPDGRLHTGDIGFVDGDGWVFIVDRAKDQINASGYKVWPREVEDVLYQHPKVKEAAVVGRPDEYRGETVAAYIVPTFGEPPTAEELDRFCRERLSAYKCPRSFDLLPELPKTLSGKVLRRELRERGR